MNLKKAIQTIKSKDDDRDILELLGIEYQKNYDSHYYREKIEKMPRGDYFISDLDGTFFRWVLQKEAFSLFVKFVLNKNTYDIKPDAYYEFMKDLAYFRELEKKAHNKKIPYFEYLNAGIFLMLRHKDLVNWKEFLAFTYYNFDTREKIKPFRFSLQKMEEVLKSGKNFLFVSGAPNFIFDIYLELLKKFVWKNIWESYANNIFGFWSHIDVKNYHFHALWGKENKKEFISSLYEKNIIHSTIGWMGDTSSDFWISYCLSPGNDFYFVNPERKVIEKYDELVHEWVSYHIIIERKDLICELEKKSIHIIL